MSKEHKVIWIVNEYNPPVAKRTRQIVLSQRLEEFGYTVYIFAGSKVHGRNDNLIKDGKPYVQVEYDGAHFIVIKIDDYSNGVKRILVSLQFQNNVWKLRNQLPKPDVIVSDFAGLFGNVFLKWKHKYGTKIIYDVLDLWPESFVDVGFIKRKSLPAKILYSMEHKSYRESDGIIFSFEGGKDYIIEKGWDKTSGGDVDVNKVGYLNNGVDLETVDKERETLFFHDPDLDTDKFKAVYLGAIRRANNTDLIVEVARTLQERKVDNIVILVYGDGDYRKGLENKVKELRLTNIIFKGPLPVEFAPNMLSRCNLNLFNFMNVPVCRFGLSPNKLFMYFASGKPVLSMVRPKYEIVESRDCGIVTENNPEAIADGIIRFSRMGKIEYDRYCMNCRKVAQEFDYKNLVSVLINQIEK
jgi:glycosyltransferase involved in cell wall biosynthesis